MYRVPRVHGVVVVAAVLALASGCSRRIADMLSPNQPPEISLRATPARDGDQALVHLTWSAHDPDGRIDHYLYAMDPRPGTDLTGWVGTAEVGHRLALARRPATPMARPGPGRDFRLFAVRAVDDRGAMSDPATRAFYW